MKKYTKWLSIELQKINIRTVVTENCSDFFVQKRMRINLEIKINKEIRDYTESLFFGLSLRQFIFSLMAMFVAVGVYFVLQPILGLETTSWVCILGAAPFAALGFIKYHGMTAEKFLMTWIKSEFLVPKSLPFKSTNIYYEALKTYIEMKEKENYNSND